MLKLTLTDGEIVIGTPNYVTEDDAQIRLPDGGFRTVERVRVEKVERLAKGGSDA